MGNTITTWRYSVPSVNGEGWAVLFLDSVGCFAAISDWGNFAHHWPVAGWRESGDFRTFIAVGASDDYILRKLAPRLEYDAEETLKTVKDAIRRKRRTQWLSRKRAREAWDQLDEFDNLVHPELFWQWYQAQTALEDAQEHRCTRRPLDAVQFIEKAWPRLKEQIRAELAKEAA